MTNEEKILEMLGSMQSEISGLKEEIKESETRMKAYVDESAQGLKAYIDEKATTATSHAIAYAEGAIIPKFDLLADGHKLTQEQITALKKDIDRIDYQLGQHEGKFYLMEQAK